MSGSGYLTTVCVYSGTLCKTCRHFKSWQVRDVPSYTRNQYGARGSAHRSTINFIVHSTFANFSAWTRFIYVTQNIENRSMPLGTSLVCDRVWERRKETHLINWLTPGGAPVPPWEGHPAYLAPSPVWELLHHPYIITIHLHDSQASLSAQGRRRTGRWPCADNGHSVSSQLTIP